MDRKISLSEYLGYLESQEWSAMNAAGEGHSLKLGEVQRDSDNWVVMLSKGEKATWVKEIEQEVG